MSTINEKINEMANTIQELRRLKTEQGSSNAPQDAMLSEKIEKINAQIDELETQIKKIQSNTQNIENNYSSSGTYTQSQKKEKSKVQDYLRKSADRSHSSPLVITRTTNVKSYNDSSIADRVHEKLQNYSILRKLTSPILISRDAFDAVYSEKPILAAWGDGNAVAEKSYSFKTMAIKTHDLTAQPAVTQRMIDDVEIDLESWLVDKLSDLFMAYEEEAFINGDGINKPFGILSASRAGYAPIQRVNSGATITADSLMNLYYSLSEVYSYETAFIMNKATVHTIRTMKDPSGQYLWMPGVLSGKADTLLGIPLYTSSAMPIVSNNPVAPVENGDNKIKGATSNDVIIYGNFKKGYQIVDRGEVTMQKDPYSNKPFIIYYATKRVGGDIVDPLAFSILRAGN